MPIFPFDKISGLARDARLSLKRKRVERKKQELARIKKEVRTAKERTERQEHKKRKKNKQQEIFELKRDLRAAERMEGVPASDVGEPAADQPTTGALPDFIIIGAKKCGTTSLYHLLTQHPHVEPAAMKEPHYFAGQFDEDIDWYRQCFPTPTWKDGRRSMTGEASANYLFYPLAPERMAEVIPRARLISLLRNPVDRAYSDYQQVSRKGRDPRTFARAVEEALEAEETRPTGGEDGADDSKYLSRGVYVDHLRRWPEYFGDEQMLVLKSEDFFENTPDVLERLLKFLDLPSWEPETWEARKIGKYNQGMDQTTRRRLEEYYEPHNRRLYEYLGKDFGW